MQKSDPGPHLISFTTVWKNWAYHFPQEAVIQDVVLEKLQEFAQP